MNGGGILRKKNQREPPNLLVFGYSCKLFRDDEKALAIDRETNLIPAPFATKEKIDRYDVRATLLDVDISQFEAPLGGYGNRLDYISSAEQEAELLAEEERYYSLFKNEVEEELYTEERKKREAAAGMSEVPFNYDTIGPKESNGDAVDNDADDLPFIASPNLDLPADMVPPATIKQNQIIEKTAKFIASQGLQMEILLKTKQANNTQFDFLNLNGKYNPYYKHIISLMKNNCYPSSIDNSEENSEASVDSTFNTQSTETEAPRIIVPVIKYKPSADCSYTQLISKITKAPISVIEQQQKLLTAPSNGHANNVVEVAKISTGLAGLLQSYNSDSETDHEEEEPEELVYDGPTPTQELQHVIDKTAAYVAKNGCSFEDILRKKNDPRFSFLDYANEFYNYYTFKVRKNGGTITVREQIPVLAPVVPVEIEVKSVLPVSFSIKPKEEKAALKVAVLVPETSSEDDDKWEPESKKSNVVPTAPSPPKTSNTVVVENVFVNHVLESSVVKEEKSAKEKLKDKLSNAAREKLGMLSKEKQLQLERKKKAMMFINQIKSELKIPVTEALIGEDNVINLTNNDDDSDVNSVFSIPLSPQRDKSKSRSSRRKRSSSRKSRSRSRSHSSSRHKHKKSKHHSKKKHRKHSKSRSSSRSSPRSSRKERT